jgi:REP element-mobilizing transposase RayT
VARPPRILVPGGLYHVVGKATGTDLLFVGRKDYGHFLTLLASVVDRFRWHCRAYCLLGTHYHLMVETPEPTLAAGMHRLNGMYGQAFNRRHGRSGHLLADRYYSVLVSKESHALELVRYIARNPVRAGLCSAAEAWWWSSYAATVGLRAAPSFLEPDEVLRWFSSKRNVGVQRLREFVESP